MLYIKTKNMKQQSFFATYAMYFVGNMLNDENNKPVRCDVCSI
jgi:hypothetical protein